MATTLVSVEEYLRTSYRPDCDYVDGVVLERNLGQLDHSKVQKRLINTISAREKEWGVLVYPELRLRVRPGEFRIPDVMVLSADAPETQVIEEPPLLCIEVLSPDDTLSETAQRVKEYAHMGVPQAWIFDPAK